MGLVQKLYLSLRDRGARRGRQTRLAVERLDARIALAVDQLWVQPGSPMSTDNPTGAATNPFHSLEEAQATIRARLVAGPQRRDIVVNIADGTYDLDGIVYSGPNDPNNPLLSIASFANWQDPTTWDRVEPSSPQPFDPRRQQDVVAVGRM